MESPKDITPAEGDEFGLTPAWFCVRSQPKHEHIAAARLRPLDDVQVYVPRIRYRRPTRQGPAWVTEALFPGYLFVRFAWRPLFRLVQSAPGVRGVVHFGEHYPIIPDQVVADIQETLGEEQVFVVTPDLTPGDAVEIVGGSFDGLRAVVTRVMPAKERVQVLLEFLGRQTAVELGVGSIIKENEGRRLVIGRPAIGLSKAAKRPKTP